MWLSWYLVYGLAEITLVDPSFRMVAVRVNGIKFRAQVQVTVPKTKLHSVLRILQINK
jgi:hypothetical protein